MKKKSLIIISIIVVFIIALSAIYFIGTGYIINDGVYIGEYTVSEDGTEMTFKTGISSSMGYIRGYKDAGGGVKPHYLKFYNTFGGLNNSWGAKSEIVLPLDEEDTEIYVFRGSKECEYELVLQKNKETGVWERISSDENTNRYARDLRSSGITDPYVNPDVKFSNLTSEEDQSELCKDLEKAGIKDSYIKDYMDYVDIYNETAPKSVLRGWNTLDKVNYDSYEIQDVWVQKYPDFVGVCCRMAAFTLLRDDILINNTDFQKTSMDSLIFDNIAFKMMPAKYMTDENLKAFEDFYAPIPTSTSTDKEEQKKVLKQALEDRGIQFKNSKLKFIALVEHDTVDESNPFLFIGHAGVIYEKNGSVYLLEKLAFQEPYQWIEFPSEEEIIKYFESKYNLDSTGTMAEPIYIINDELF